MVLHKILDQYLSSYQTWTKSIIGFENNEANVNALKQTRLIIIHAFYMIPWTLQSKTPVKSIKSRVDSTVRIRSRHVVFRSFCEKCNDVDVNKNQDKMLIPGSLTLLFDVTWTIYVPFWGFSSKNHVHTVRESHDSNMDLVVWKRLLVDLTMASNRCVHRYLCKNRIRIAVLVIIGCFTN